MCDCVRERESDRERKREGESVCVRARERESVKENGREIKRAPARERETVKEINLGLLERLQVSEAAANNTHTHTHSHIHALTHALIVICVLDSFVRPLNTLECAIH